MSYKIPKEIPKKSENPLGLYKKYAVYKIDETKQTIQPVDSHSQYFPLRLDFNAPDRDRLLAARRAVHVYADFIEATEPQLAEDIRKQWPIDLSDIPVR